MSIKSSSPFGCDKLTRQYNVTRRESFNKLKNIFTDQVNFFIQTQMLLLLELLLKLLLELLLELLDVPLLLLLLLLPYVFMM